MNSLRLALSELRRLCAGRLPRLAVLAVVMIPTLYASLYLWANHDPYGRLAKVEAALVVEDLPATSEGGDEIAAGREVAKDLIEDGSFAWREVSADDAALGVESGEYLFALTIPEGFSTALASTADFDPQQGTLLLTTNAANNYLSTTIADQVLSKVSSSIAQNVSERAASQFLLGFSTLHDKLAEAGQGAARLADGLGDAQDGSRQLADGAATLADGEQDLVDGQRRLGAGLSDAVDGSARLEKGSRSVADGTAELAAAGDRVAAAAKQAREDLATARDEIEEGLADSGLSEEEQQRILARLDRLERPLDRIDDRVQGTARQVDRLADGADQVADGTATLHDGLRTAQDGSDQLVSGQVEARDGANRLRDGSADLAKGIDEAQSGAARLADGLKDGLRSIPNLTSDQRDETASTIASPIRTEDVQQASVDSYGSGLAPFFLSIGAWVGGYVMFLLVRPLSNRAIAARQSPLRTALGGWLTPFALAAAQVSIMLGVVMAVVGIDVLRATQVALFLLLVAAAFVAIVHCLNAWLGPVGQLLGLVLLVLQLAASGGTFPWQTLPPVLQTAHQVLPMSYALDGIRHLMYGASLDGLPRDIAVLAAYVVGCLALTSAAAYRRRIWRVSQIKPEIAL